MKLKAQHVFTATLVLAQIIREGRPMPQKGKYRIARMHAKLLQEFNVLNAQRDELIKAYDHHELVPDPLDAEKRVPSPDFSVPADKMPEFLEAWGKIASEDLEVDVQPIPLGQLDLGDGKDGCIHAAELIDLDDLVCDDDPPALLKAA